MAVKYRAKNQIRVDGHRTQGAISRIVNTTSGRHGFGIGDLITVGKLVIHRESVVNHRVFLVDVGIGGRRHQAGNACIEALKVTNHVNPGRIDRETGHVHAELDIAVNVTGRKNRDERGTRPESTVAYFGAGLDFKGTGSAYQGMRTVDHHCAVPSC